MAQAEPTWELMKEAEQMIVALCQMHPEKFGKIDPDLIGCAAITGKDKPATQVWDAKIGGIREPEALWSKKKYCIQFFRSTWDSYDEIRRAAMLFRMLERIPDECNGKVSPETLKDSYCLVKAFGTDYMKSATLPNLLKEKQIFGENKPTSDAPGA